MSTWEKMARRLEEEYGAYVDWEERFFECPECGEPIYEGDWSTAELGRGLICPVCNSWLE